MADSTSRPTPQELEQLDQNTLVKKLLEAVNSSSELQSMVPDNVTHLLTTALSQVIQQQQQQLEDCPPLQNNTTPATNQQQTEETAPSCDLHRHYLTPADNVESTIEVSGYSNDQRPLGIKFPAETRRKIISMRKLGIKCKDIAKDLGASVSGVQKVWERFLATGTIKDRRSSTNSYGSVGKQRKQSTKHEENLNDDIVNVSSSCVPSNMVTVPQPQSAVLIDTRETMEAPGATVEIIASSTTPHDDTGVLPAKKKPKHSYREELLMRLVSDCPLAMIKNDITMATSPHLLNLSESIHKPLYMEYVLGHPFGKAPSPRPFEANLDESKVILTDPVNPLGKEVIAALGYSTKVYFNACCKASPLFNANDYQFIPYSTGPDHIANTMRDVLQVMVNLCSDPVQGLELVPKGPGPVLQAQSKTGETVMTTFTPPTKLSEYWAQIYAYAGIFQCCENFLSPGPPSCPCLICHPFESFADSLDICEYSPVISPANDHLTSTTSSTINTSQLLSTEHIDTTPTVVMETSPEEIIISQDTSETAVTEEVCITEATPLEDSTSVQVTTSDGIQYVAYNNNPNQSSLMVAAIDTTDNVVQHSPRRSARKRQYLQMSQEH